jgi:hypothetical protein
MYPTVCTLMGLWDFVRAKGVGRYDDTTVSASWSRRRGKPLVESLRYKEGWQDLAALVQILPDHDLLPVRAQYPDSETTTIGLNFLTTRESLWFTLADVLASKILTGRTPKVLGALGFEPMEKQGDLKSIIVAGKTITPATDDFYQRLIMHRNALKGKLKTATEAEKPALKSDQQGAKILANATSYGIFVELNIEDYVTTKSMIGSRRTSGHRTESRLGVLRYRQHRNSQHTQPLALRV